MWLGKDFIFTYLLKRAPVWRVDTGSVRIVQSPPGYASLGSRLLLSCSYTADTVRSVRVSWLRGRQRVEGQWYIIDTVRREDDGRYTCVVNAAGHVLTADAVVRVQCTVQSFIQIPSWVFNPSLQKTTPCFNY